MKGKRISQGKYNKRREEPQELKQKVTCKRRETKREKSKKKKTRGKETRENITCKR